MPTLRNIAIHNNAIAALSGGAPPIELPANAQAIADLLPNGSDDFIFAFYPDDSYYGGEIPSEFRGFLQDDLGRVQLRSVEFLPEGGATSLTLGSNAHNALRFSDTYSGYDSTIAADLYGDAFISLPVDLSATPFDMWFVLGLSDISDSRTFTLAHFGASDDTASNSFDVTCAVDASNLEAAVVTFTATMHEVATGDAVSVTVSKTMDLVGLFGTGAILCVSLSEADELSARLYNDSATVYQTDTSIALDGGSATLNQKMTVGQTGTGDAVMRLGALLAYQNAAADPDSLRDSVAGAFNTYYGTIGAASIF